jgi:hypothetical protein
MSIAITEQKIHDPPSHRIFVFGSNLAGIHGAGAALHAKRFYGAEQGVAIGHINQCYAIPTKDQMLRPLSLGQIKHFVNSFLAYAKNHPNLLFDVTRIGCGLAGYRDDQIAPFFKHATNNCWFDAHWQPELGPEKQYWTKRP